MKMYDDKSRKNLAEFLICLFLTLGIVIPGFAAGPTKTTPAQVAAKTPTVIATLKADPVSYSGTCPATIKFEGKISVAGITKANSPFKATYEFIRSDGAKDTKPKTLIFKQDGSQTVATAWTLGDDKRPPIKGWMAIKIAGKPPVESNKAEFSLQCKAGQQATSQPAQEAKADDMKFTQTPLRKISSLYSPTEIKQAKELNKNVIRNDLVCSIKAYYDEARTIPVQAAGEHMGIYHMEDYQAPVNNLVYFRIEVKNIGRLSTAKVVLNKIDFINNQNLFPPTSYTTTPPVNLEPGEAAEYDYSYGPFTRRLDSKVINKTIYIHVLADSMGHVAEDDETNNACDYALKFVWP